MNWLVRRLMGLFRSERASVGTEPEVARHHATLRRADRLLRVVAEYSAADKARRDRR